MAPSFRPPEAPTPLCPPLLRVPGALASEALIASYPEMGNADSAARWSPEVATHFGALQPLGRVDGGGGGRGRTQKGRPPVKICMLPSTIGLGIRWDIYS